MKRSLMFLSLGALIVSLNAHALHCTNDPNDVTDGVNLTLDLDNITSGRHLIGDVIRFDHGVQWSHVDARFTALSGSLTFDGQTIVSNTTTPPSPGYTSSGTLTPTTTGEHKVKVSSPQAPGCTLTSTFFKPGTAYCQYISFIQRGYICNPIW